MSKRIAARRGLWVALAASVVLAGCGGNDAGTLSDQAYAYCTTEASPEELAAAARALNLQVDADAFASYDRGDAVFEQACEYAYKARDGNLDAPPGQPLQPGVIDEGPASPPHDPQASDVPEVSPSLP